MKSLVNVKSSLILGHLLNLHSSRDIYRYSSQLTDDVWTQFASRVWRPSSILQAFPETSHELLGEPQKLLWSNIKTAQEFSVTFYRPAKRGLKRIKNECISNSVHHCGINMKMTKYVSRRFSPGRSVSKYIFLLNQA